MLKVKKQISIFLVVLVLCLPFMSINVSAAKLNKTKISLKVGQTYKLKVRNSGKKVTWKSSNKKIATVSKKGVVKAKKKGKTTITVKVGSKKYKCRVVVRKKR